MICAQINLAFFVRITHPLVTKNVSPIWEQIVKKYKKYTVYT